MHIITRRRLLEFTRRHPECARALDAWYRAVKRTDFYSFSSLRELFPSADRVGKLTVFNIGGNKVRLIAAVHYNRRRIYVRRVLTHAEYDLGNWKE